MRAVTTMTAVALLVGGLGVSGCATIHKGESAVKAGRTIEKSVRGDQATIDSFTTSIKSSENATFEATYKTSGASPATVVYAVRPPAGVAFSDTPARHQASSGRVDIIANSTGEYFCTPASASQPTAQCEKASALDKADENSLFAFYTPSHWVAFLKGLSLAAGFAGDKVSTSTKVLNGFTMRCVDFRATGVKGLSTICTASQGVLGYVKVAGDSTSFELTKFTASPPAALFELPAGAKVTSLPTSVPTSPPTSG
jgi:hypothetical protein